MRNTFTAVVIVATIILISIVLVMRESAMGDKGFKPLSDSIQSSIDTAVKQ